MRKRPLRAIGRKISQAKAELETKEAQVESLVAESQKVLEQLKQQVNDQQKKAEQLAAKKPPQIKKLTNGMRSITASRKKRGKDERKRPKRIREIADLLVEAVPPAPATSTMPARAALPGQLPA